MQTEIPSEDESADLHTIRDAEPNLTFSMMHRDSPLCHFNPFSLAQLRWLSRIFGVDLRTRVYLLPRLPAFLIKATFLSTDTCLLNYWLLRRWATEPGFGNIFISLWTTSGKTCRTYININRYRSFGLPLRIFLHLLPLLLSSSSGFLLLSIKQCWFKYTIHLQLLNISLVSLRAMAFTYQSVRHTVGVQ